MTKIDYDALIAWADGPDGPSTPELVANVKCAIRQSKVAQEFVHILSAYKAEFPAFRSAPIGGPGSIARRKQDELIVMEDAARAAIAAFKKAGKE